MEALIYKLNKFLDMLKELNYALPYSFILNDIDVIRRLFTILKLPQERLSKLTIIAAIAQEVYLYIEQNVGEEVSLIYLFICFINIVFIILASSVFKVLQIFWKHFRRPVFQFLAAFSTWMSFIKHSRHPDHTFSRFSEVSTLIS